VTAEIGRASIGNEKLQIRIGIATGLVVVGEPIGTDEAYQQTAIGETPNRTARLQGLAGTDGIVIDDATHRQTGGLLDCVDIGLVRLKGLSEPVRARQVLKEAAVDSRFEALHATASLAPLVGRQEELDLLLRRWTQARAGQGGLVMISGEPGIGKSRLIAELEERLLTEPHSSLHYFCSPHHQDIALHPIITRWERDLGIAHGDAPVERLGKLEALLTALEAPREDFRLIADLLSIPVDTHYPAPELSPMRRRERIFAAYCRALVLRAAAQPVLMFFEDAHWADRTSLELIDTLIGRLPDLPILLVVSFRSEFTAPWIGRTGVTLITLGRLTRRQARELATEVSREHVLPPLLLERIVARSDGVPLFIEELTNTVVETTSTTDRIDPSLAVPATLQGSLMTRLDQLPVAKQVAQISAVIGREFSRTLLAAVAQLPDAQLAQGLEELIMSGVVARWGVPPDASYAFKHALVRDAAYESLLRSRRANIHAAIVHAMEGDAYIAAREPEVLGYHCAQAGLAQKAAIYYRKAAGTPERLAEVQALLERALEFDPASWIDCKIGCSAR
jgi:predicted ATPase